MCISLFLFSSFAMSASADDMMRSVFFVKRTLSRLLRVLRSSSRRSHRSKRLNSLSLLEKVYTSLMSLGAEWLSFSDSVFTTSYSWPLYMRCGIG